MKGDEQVDHDEHGSNDRCCEAYILPPATVAATLTVRRCCGREHASRYTQLNFTLKFTVLCNHAGLQPATAD